VLFLLTNLLPWASAWHFLFKKKQSCLNEYLSFGSANNHNFKILKIQNADSVSAEQLS